MLTALRVAPRAPTASPPRRGRPRGAPARATSARARLAPSSSDADPSARRRASSSSSSASDPERRVSEPSPLALAASMPALSLALPALPATLGAVLASGYAFPATWACAAIPCCLGFLNPVYVFSVGYGLAVASAALGVLAMASASGAWIPALCLAHVFGAVVYGLRLGGFLYWRSVTWSEWGKRAQNAPEAKAKSIVAKIPVVLLCSLLYACMCSPILWHAKVANAIPGGYLPVVITGVGMQWLGAALEAVADHQKSAYKATDAGKTRWCDVGVYARCRHPNYLGELAFWFGTFLAGVPAMLVAGAGSFLPAALGLAFIAKLMTSQCGKQDEKQAGRYGEQKAYREWVANSGSLFPKMA